MTRYRRDPASTKILSYLKDTADSYAKNKRNGRKAVRKRKAHVNRSFRRLTHQTLSQQGIDTGEAELPLKRKSWRKIRDASLVDSLDYAWSGSSSAKANRKYHISPLRKEAIRRQNRTRGYRPSRYGDDE